MQTAYSKPTTLVKFSGYDFYFDSASGLIFPGNIQPQDDCVIDHVASFLAEQADDSMVPNIKPGDCLVNIVMEPGAINRLSEGIYGVMRRKPPHARHTVQIGRLVSSDMPVNKTLTLRADNPAHGQLTVGVEEILCLFQVKAVNWN